MIRSGEHELWDAYLARRQVAARQRYLDELAPFSSPEFQRAMRDFQAAAARAFAGAISLAEALDRLNQTSGPPGVSLRDAGERVAPGARRRRRPTDLPPSNGTEVPR